MIPATTVVTTCIADSVDTAQPKKAKAVMELLQHHWRLQMKVIPRVKVIHAPGHVQDDRFD